MRSLRSMNFASSLSLSLSKRTITRTHFVNPRPSMRSTIQHPGSSRSSRSNCLTYSKREHAICTEMCTRVFFLRPFDTIQLLSPSPRRFAQSSRRSN